MENRYYMVSMGNLKIMESLNAIMFTWSQPSNYKKSGDCYKKKKAKRAVFFLQMLNSWHLSRRLKNHNKALGENDPLSSSSRLEDLSNQALKITRLTYNCAHLRSTKESLGENYLGENFFE